MSVIISHTRDQGDGTTQVFFRTPGGEEASVVCGHDKLADGSVYEVMDRHAILVDEAAAVGYTGRTEGAE
jgi:hypothetical protein